jgi:hypothetical protein
LQARFSIATLLPRSRSPYHGDYHVKLTYRFSDPHDVACAAAYSFAHAESCVIRRRRTSNAVVWTGPGE